MKFKNRGSDPQALDGFFKNRGSDPQALDGFFKKDIIFIF
jgi:hypothetical protein